jgi:hypothetical protein
VNDLAENIWTDLRRRNRLQAPATHFSPSIANFVPLNTSLFNWDQQSKIRVGDFFPIFVDTIPHPDIRTSSIYKKTGGKCVKVKSNKKRRASSHIHAFIPQGCCSRRFTSSFNSMKSFFICKHPCKLALAFFITTGATNCIASTSYLVTFGQEQYVIQGGETFPVQVFISPAPPAGLYSLGLKMRLNSTNAQISGVGAISVPADFSFDGPRAQSAVVAVGSNFAAIKSTTQFYSDSLHSSSNALLATFFITDKAPGSYQLQLEFFNTLGPTENIFVDGAGQVLDPYITFNTATVVREGPMTETNLTSITLNRQTGFFEQMVRVTNTRVHTAPAVRLHILNLAATWTVMNGSGTTNNHPFIQYNSALNPGEFVDLRVEYRIPNRIPTPQPNYDVEVVGVLPPPPTPNGTPQPLPVRAILPDGSFLLEFSSLSNRSYSIQYSHDLATWTTVVPALRGNGSQIQWIDYGPPKTDRPPSSDLSRFYRLFLLP